MMPTISKNCALFGAGENSTWCWFSLGYTYLFSVFVEVPTSLLHASSMQSSATKDFHIFIGPTERQTPKQAWVFMRLISTYKMIATLDVSRVGQWRYGLNKVRGTLNPQSLQIRCERTAGQLVCSRCARLNLECIVVAHQRGQRASQHSKATPSSSSPTPRQYRRSEFPVIHRSRSTTESESGQSQFPAPVPPSNSSSSNSPSSTLEVYQPIKDDGDTSDGDWLRAPIALGQPVYHAPRTDNPPSELQDPISTGFLLRVDAEVLYNL